MLIKESDEYTVGKSGDREIKRTRNFFIDNSKTYIENYQKLGMVNEMILKTSMDKGRYYDLKRSMLRFYLEKETWLKVRE